MSRRSGAETKKAMGPEEAECRDKKLMGPEEEEEEEKEKEKKMKEKKKKNWPTFWFGTFAMLFSTTGCVVRHENGRLL